MDRYPLFLVVAATAVLMPGPGVLLTLTNAAHGGVLAALSGILGIASGTLVLAAVSASSLGAVLSTSDAAFFTLKYVGAAYLLYLGLRMWRSCALTPSTALRVPAQQGLLRRYWQGVSLQLTNPKAVLFLVSVFPQFVSATHAYAPQLLLLALTYSGLVVLIHTGYALAAHRAQRWLTSERGARSFQKLGGAAFIGFAAAMALSSRQGA